jgi:hypothetical protein
MLTVEAAVAIKLYKLDVEVDGTLNQHSTVKELPLLKNVQLEAAPTVKY